MATTLYENDGIKCDKVDDFAVFYMKTDASTLLFDIGLRDDYHAFLTNIVSDDSVKGIAYVNDQALFDDAVYGEMVERLFKQKSSAAKQAFEKIINSVSVLSHILLGCGKPTACGMIGAVGYDYLGLSMLYNYRCVSDDSTFINTAYRYGIPPIALLPFFLRQSIGQANTSDVLLLKEVMPSEEIKAYEIVQDVVPADKVLNTCLTNLEKMAKIPVGAFAVMQRIAQPLAKDLDAYLDIAKKQTLAEIMHK